MPKCRCGMHVPDSMPTCLNCGRAVSAGAASTSERRSVPRRPSTPNIKIAPDEAPPPEPHQRRVVTRSGVKAAAVDDGEGPARNALEAPLAPRAVQRVVAPPQLDGLSCSVCGRRPAVTIKLRRHLGLILVMRMARLEGAFCREHGEAVASEYLRRTLVEGWWGILSFFVNWYALYIDIVALREVRRLAPAAGERSELPPDTLPDEIRTVATETAEGRTERRRVVGLAVTAIAFSAFAMFVPQMAHLDSSGTMTRRLAVDLAITVFLYATVGVLIAVRSARINVTPRLVDGGSALTGVLMGLLVGGGTGFVLAEIVSLISGGVTSDPRIMLVVSEGNAVQILAVVFVGILAAPVIEEFLFRGLLVESLRTKGRTSAIIGGAVAFSFWHVNPSALRYYVLVGFLLGYMYWRFGLAGSVATHFAFNGMLTLFAFLAVGSTSVFTATSGVSATVPGGWRRVHTAELASFDIAVQSPGGAGLLVEHVDAPVALPSPTASQAPPDATNVRVGSLNGSPALRYDTTKDGHAAEVVLVTRGHRGYTIVLVPEQSTKASAQFERMLQTIVLPAT